MYRAREKLLETNDRVINILTVGLPLPILSYEVEVPGAKL
jgi:hypothetical protein